jgi:hypothetical protein
MTISLSIGLWWIYMRGLILSWIGYALTFAAFLAWLLVVSELIVEATGNIWPRKLISATPIATSAGLVWFFLLLLWDTPLAKGVRPGARVTRGKWKDAQRRTARRH